MRTHSPDPAKRQAQKRIGWTDAETRQAIRDLYRGGYLADPHSALAWAALRRSLAADEQGVFLCTAHPAKFLEVIEDTLGIEVDLPEELAAVRDKPVLSTTISGRFEEFRRELIALGQSGTGFR